MEHTYIRGDTGHTYIHEAGTYIHDIQHMGHGAWHTYREAGYIRWGGYIHTYIGHYIHTYSTYAGA